MPDPTPPARWKGYARDLYIEDSLYLDPATYPPAHLSSRIYLDGRELPAMSSGWSMTGGRNQCTTVTVEAFAKDVTVDGDRDMVRLGDHNLLVPEDAVPDLDGLEEYDTVTLQFFIASAAIGGPLP